MKRISRLIIGVFVCMSLLGNVHAQENATYVDEVAVQDSSYMAELFMEEEGSGSSDNTILFVAIGLVVAAGGYFLLRKKKK